MVDIADLHIGKPNGTTTAGTPQDTEGIAGLAAAECPGMNSPRLVILESPYAAATSSGVAANVEYARRAVRDSLARGEAPIASHLLYTQPGILNDEIPSERAQGIDAGLAWRAVAQGSVVYADHGITRGMKYGIASARAAGLAVEIRYLDRARLDYFA